MLPQVVRVEGVEQGAAQHSLRQSDQHFSLSNLSFSVPFTERRKNKPSLECTYSFQDVSYLLKKKNRTTTYSKRLVLTDDQERVREGGGQGEVRHGECGHGEGGQREGGQGDGLGGEDGEGGQPLLDRQDQEYLQILSIQASS